MKKIRLLAFMCTLVMLFGSLSFASASSPAMHTKGADSKAIAYTTLYGYTLENGKSVSFSLMPDDVYTLYYVENPYEYNAYSSIIFGCEGAVKAKCSASWVHITDKDSNIALSFDYNTSYKTRKATITVTGKNYKAKVKLTQFGIGKFTSVVRKKKTVSGKIKMPKGSKGGYISVQMSDENYKTSFKAIPVKSGKASMKFKFKVKTGWKYSLSLYVYYPRSEIRYFERYADGLWFEITADSVGKTETLR